MNDRLLGAFRAFLVGWACLIVAHFVYVQTKTSWGAEDLAWDPTNLWHPIYFGVLNATLVIVPFALFQVPTARRYGGWSSAVGRAILALGIGTVLWGFGNFYWFAKNATGTEAPYPSLADAGYLAVLPFAAWSLWELSKVFGHKKREGRWLPVALLFAFPLNAYIMLPQGIGAGTFDTPLSATISSTYILADVVLLGVAIIIAVGARRAAGGRFFAPVLGVVVSLSMLYIGDLFFNYRIANDIFYNAEISDLLYGGFIVLSSYAVYLFLVADVRANQAIQQADDEWEPSLAAIRTSDGPTLAPLDELATAILRGQERTMGAQTARSIAAGLSGVEIDADGIAHAVDAIAIDSMVREYRSIAGPLGEMTSWTAARGVLTRHPDLDITSFARFRAGTATATGSSSARQPTVGV